MSARPALSVGLLALVLPVLLAGCSALPEDGPVVTGDRTAAPAAAEPFEYNPPGPRAGALPDDIVTGFLSAQQAVPVSTRVAQEYLTEDAAETWRPDRRTIVYTSQEVVATGDRVRVRLRGASTLDANGRWQGPWSGDGRGSLRLRVEREGAQWRIVDPPPALTIPRSHFEARYQELSLFFFDPSGSVLVPETVYLPSGVQAATRLVAGLVDGPQSQARAVERSYLPPGTDLGVGVPIRGGVADVPLSAQVAELRPGDLSRVLAQLTTTLRQLPEVRGLRVLVDGEPMGLPGDAEVLPVDSGAEYSPTVDWASPDLFGLSGRRIVRLTAGDASTVRVLSKDLVAVTGRPRSLGVSIAADRSAVVSGDGASVWTTTAREGVSTPPTLEIRGTDWLRPVWDRTGRLWLLDRAAPDVLRVRSDAEGDRRLRVPGLAGADVRAMALSRDGTRLAVAVGRGGDRAEVLLSRVVRDTLGVPLRITAPIRLTPAFPIRRLLDIGWRAPTQVAVMTRPSAFSTRVQVLSSDGASVVPSATARIDLQFEESVAMASSPGDPQALVTVTADGRAQQVDADGRWVEAGLPVALRAPAFVG